MQRLQKLSTPLRVLVYVAAAAAMLAVAAGVGATVALMFASDGGSPEGAKPQQVQEAKPQQAEDAKPEQASKRRGTGDRPGEAEYLREVDDIQNASVEASLDSNDKLLRYDRLTAADIEELETNHATLEDYSAQVEDLAPPEGYEDQHRVFVLAIGELREANELAYRLAADPTSATQANFEAYDRHVFRATSYLRRSNEILGRDYKTTEAAQEVSFG